MVWEPVVVSKEKDFLQRGKSNEMTESTGNVKERE